MTMLETNRNEMLRRRFGWMADQACRTIDDKDGEPAPRKKGDVPERKSIRSDNDTWYFMTMWMLANCQMQHFTMN